MHAAELIASPRCDDADPATALMIVLAEAVPWKLELDAPEGIGPDVLSLRTDHDGGGGTVGQRFGCRPLRSHVLAGRLHRKVDVDAITLPMRIVGRLRFLRGFVDPQCGR